jgi:hypothetical protein
MGHSSSITNFLTTSYLAALLSGAIPKKKRRSRPLLKVDKNIPEEQVYDELRELCSGETPEEKYITKIMELGAGAGGVVTLAKVRIQTTGVPG